MPWSVLQDFFDSLCLLFEALEVPAESDRNINDVEEESSPENCRSGGRLHPSSEQGSELSPGHCLQTPLGRLQPPLCGKPMYTSWLMLSWEGLACWLLFSGSESYNHHIWRLLRRIFRASSKLPVTWRRAFLAACVEWAYTYSFQSVDVFQVASPLFLLLIWVSYSLPS